MKPGAPEGLDRIFAPEKLRENWQTCQRSTGKRASQEGGDASVDADLETLARHLGEGFQGEQAAVLFLCLEELVALAAAPGQQDAMGGLLDEMEDLMVAFAIGNGEGT